MAKSALLLSLATILAGCGSLPGSADEDAVVLFDGKSLGAFRSSAFGGDGEVHVEDGRMILEMGSPLTGVTWSGEPLPTVDYELRFTAARLAGTDFFCGLTFPVGERSLSLILGGWGGSVCGISSLDGLDASENETTRFVYLETGKAFDVRVVVTAERLTVHVDGEALADVELAGKELDIRPEVDRSRPLGIASFGTRAAIGPITLRRTPRRPSA
ncbi:MAG: DUF1080 domain-containing protein [Planctomycetota bacterium]|nr:DUF1080 domain-containing protein [Planctomycetota bacterium]MDA0933163.1 DUF1080 domain-containing protein [Planctomycetota bacterium]MDA1220993.1 DUF1080 domain-containing protein [Planctomycetota bacterium]